MTKTVKQGLSGGDLLLIGLALIFITLKLTGVIAWSWWWVTAPIWAPIVLAITIAIVVGLAILIYKAFKK